MTQASSENLALAGYTENPAAVWATTKSLAYNSLRPSGYAKFLTDSQMAQLERIGQDLTNTSGASYWQDGFGGPYSSNVPTNADGSKELYMIGAHAPTNGPASQITCSIFDTSAMTDNWTSVTNMISVNGLVSARAGSPYLGVLAGIVLGAKGSSVVHNVKCGVNPGSLLAATCPSIINAGCTMNGGSAKQGGALVCNDAAVVTGLNLAVKSTFNGSSSMNACNVAADVDWKSTGVVGTNDGNSPVNFTDLAAVGGVNNGPHNFNCYVSPDSSTLSAANSLDGTCVWNFVVKGSGAMVVPAAGMLVTGGGAANQSLHPWLP